MLKIVIVSLVLLVVGLFVLQQVDPNVSHQGGESISSLVEKNKIKATIEGEVVVPGIYNVEISDTLLDLVTLAGGLLESADYNAINLDITIDTRDYFYIPSKSAYQSSCEITTQQEKLNVNTATSTQLATIKYISVALAERIVTYRTENGEFQTLEDLMNVTGIGRATYERIRDSLTLK